MYVRYCVLMFLVQFYVTKAESHSWDLAVAINTEIELLTSNGTLIGTAVQQFSKLKALAYDAVRHQFLVSDMDQLIDTIFTVNLTKETEISPVVQDLPDDVQGLAVNPITDVLYWTDKDKGTINYVSLKDPSYTPNVLFEFKDENPQDIAVDSCKGYVYWTNANINSPSIERSTLDGKNRTVLVTGDLFLPAGIAIDHLAQRIYWADRGPGIYFRIESTDFDGNKRLIVHQGTHQEPFGIALDENCVYWTDRNNNALWRKYKHDPTSALEKLRTFDEKPMGLIAKERDLNNATDCGNLEEAIKTYTGPTTEHFEERTDRVESTECFNGVVLGDQGCKCHRGYTGSSCELPICYNFCVHGNCRLSSFGYTECSCLPGFIGIRCERSVCDGYCLNGGSCSSQLVVGRVPVCECPDGFRGDRCEITINTDELCGLFCEGRQNDVLVDKINSFICKCGTDSYSLLRPDNSTREGIIADNSFNFTFMTFLQNPVFICMAVSLLVMIVIIIVLSKMVFKSRHRPRIKKRIIVNKNVTPLTFRQPPTEQCEITIENCCNMNVCETPCFDPPTLRNFKKEEKKTLLSNMENGDDLY